MPHVKLTQPFVNEATALPGAERTIYWHHGQEGFGLMVTAAGHKSFIVQYRARGVSRRYTCEEKQLVKALSEARAVLGKAANGADPVQEARKAKGQVSSTLKAIAEEHLQRERKRLRSIDDRRRILRRYVYPRLGSRQIDSIKRSEIVGLLDRIEDKSGPAMADQVLAIVRRVMTWHAARSDDFRPPVIKGMARTRPKERARERILSDDEIRVFWAATDDWEVPYGRLVRFLLLSAARLREASNMQRAELSGGDWAIPAARHKSKREFLLPLSQAALDVLASTPVIGRKGLVFTTDGSTSISGFSKAKRQLDKRILAELRKHDPKAEPLPRWTNHDLRRTARSLMSRAGVPSKHAEMALGHVVQGVEGVYDRYAYRDEKKAALEALAREIKSILNPASPALVAAG